MIEMPGCLTDLSSRTGSTRSLEDFTCEALSKQDPAPGKRNLRWSMHLESADLPADPALPAARDVTRSSSEPDLPLKCVEEPLNVPKNTRTRASGGKAGTGRVAKEDQSKSLTDPVKAQGKTRRRTISFQGAKTPALEDVKEVEEVEEGKGGEVQVAKRKPAGRKAAAAGKAPAKRAAKKKADAPEEMVEAAAAPPQLPAPELDRQQTLVINIAINVPPNSGLTPLTVQREMKVSAGDSGPVLIDLTLPEQVVVKNEPEEEFERKPKLSEGKEVKLTKHKQRSKYKQSQRKHHAPPKEMKHVSRSTTRRKSTSHRAARASRYSNYEEEESSSCTCSESSDGDSCSCSDCKSSTGDSCSSSNHTYSSDESGSNPPPKRKGTTRGRNRK